MGLYYVIKVNGEERKNSEDKIKNNQVRASWSFKLPDQFEGEEKIEVQFYDQDQGRDCWVCNHDDLIGSDTFSAEKFGEENDEMSSLGGESSPYRKRDTKYMMSCVDDWI